MSRCGTCAAARKLMPRAVARQFEAFDSYLDRRRAETKAAKHATKVAAHATIAPNHATGRR